MKSRITNLMKPYTNRILGAFFAMASLACSNDDSDGDIQSGCLNNFNWVTAVSDEATAFTNAAAAYATNQTEATCSAYESAALAYVDALEDAFDCVDGSDRAELEAAADEARSEISDGICD